jgi:CRP-like cAMP-binding protein
MADHLQQNLILSRLATGDFKLLEPHLTPVDLPVRKMLEHRGRKINNIYFPESGFASVVANGDKRPIEVGIIGREGMTGITVLLGGDRNSHETYIQAAGHGQSIRARLLRDAITASPSLQLSLLRYVRHFLDQTTQTAVSNGRSSIEERLARWLLMASDRLDDEELPLTHEFLAMMLSVRRPGVTVAVQELEREGMIERRRGRIFIIDRKALEKKSNGTYVRAEYD